MRPLECSILALNKHICVPLFQYFMYFKVNRTGEPCEELYYEVPIESNKSTPLEVQNHNKSTPLEVQHYKASLWATVFPGGFSHPAQVRQGVSRER